MGSLDLISSPSHSVKIQIMGRKVCLKTKYCWVLSTNFLLLKVCWQGPAMFCLYTSNKLSRQLFEFSLKVKVMRSNPGYLLILYFFYFTNLPPNTNLTSFDFKKFVKTKKEYKFLQSPRPVKYNSPFFLITCIQERKSSKKRCILNDAQ